MVEFGERILASVRVIWISQMDSKQEERNTSEKLKFETKAERV